MSQIKSAIASDAEILESHLRGVAVGSIATFDELRGVIGKPVRFSDPAFSSLQKAIRKLDSESIVFDNVKGVGYKRLNADEVIEKRQARERQSIRRRANRSKARLSGIDPADVKPENRPTLVWEMVQAQATAKINRKATKRQLGAVANNDHRALSEAEASKALFGID